MLKKKITWIVGAYLLIIAALIVFTPKELDWTDNFLSSSKAPYGSFIAFEELESIFSDLSREEKSLYTTVDDSLEFSGNYIIVTDQFFISEVEQDNLLHWISKGNTAFISSADFTTSLLDTLNLVSNLRYFNFDGVMQSEMYVTIEDVKTEKTHRYDYNKELAATYFSNKNDSLLQSEPISFYEQLNADKDQYSILMKRQFGQGTIYLHSLPRAFTNYYMLYNRNHEYASQVLSYLPDTNTKWDEYYKPTVQGQESNLSLFLSTRSFRWSYYLAIALAALYMLFKIKRTQRIIPIIKPPENRSLEFTKTIGDLYWSTDDSYDLTKKMENHFKEHLKTKYFMSNFQGSPEDITRLAVKSGKSQESIERINRYFERYKTQTLSDNQLIQLNQHLHTFYYGGE